MSIPSELYNQIMALDPADRAALAGLLLRSLEPEAADPPADVEAAWAEETEERARAVEEGREPLIPWEAVKVHLRGAASPAEGR